MGLKESLMNQDFLPMLSMLVLFPMIFLVQYVPDPFKLVFVILIEGGMIGMMVGIHFYAMLAVSKYKHLDTTFRTIDGLAIEKHIYLSGSTESANLQERSLAETLDLLKKKAEKEGAEKEGKPFPDINNWKEWTTFRLKLIFSLTLPGFEKVEQLIVLSRKDFDNTFQFRPRKDAALWLGEVVDHPSSDACTMYLYPHPHDEFQKKIPIAFIVETGGYHPDAILDFPLDLPNDVAVAAEVRELQEQNVRLDGENNILKSQLKGLTDLAFEMDEAVAERVVAYGALQDDIRSGKNKSNIRMDITLLLALGLIVFAVIYFNMNPQASLMIQQVSIVYGPEIMIVLVIFLVLMLVFYRGGKKK